MSWHTSGLLAQVDTPKKSYQTFLESLGVDEPVFEKASSFDAAISRDDGSMLAIASVDGWTSVWGSMLMFAVGDTEMKKVLKPFNAFSFTLEGTSDTYLFEWWVKGSRKRKRMVQEGKVGIDEGKPLAAEVEVFKKEKDDEQRILLLLEELTLPLARLTKPKYHVFTAEDPLSSLMADDE